MQALFTRAFELANQRLERWHDESLKVERQERHEELLESLEHAREKLAQNDCLLVIDLLAILSFQGPFSQAENDWSELLLVQLHSEG